MSNDVIPKGHVLLLLSEHDANLSKHAMITSYPWDMLLSEHVL